MEIKMAWNDPVVQIHYDYTKVEKPETIANFEGFRVTLPQVWFVVNMNMAYDNEPSFELTTNHGGDKFKEVLDQKTLWEYDPQLKLWCRYLVDVKGRPLGLAEFRGAGPASMDTDGVLKTPKTEGMAGRGSIIQTAEGPVHMRGWWHGGRPEDYREVTVRYDSKYLTGYFGTFIHQDLIRHFGAETQLGREWTLAYVTKTMTHESGKTSKNYLDNLLTALVRRPQVCKDELYYLAYYAKWERVAEHTYRIREKE